MGARVVIVGGGIAGLSGALLLARDGHHVTVVERDPSPPPPLPAVAWDEWPRRGVNQFRLSHGFLPRFRELLEAELPDVAVALEAAGALRWNRLALSPEAMTGGWRDGDERFESLTGRRPMVEATIAALVAREPGVDVRRGVAVRGLRADHGAGAPRISGVVIDGGDEIPADLVVDAGGRRSMLPEWLGAVGAAPSTEERAESGCVYYARHYRSPDGARPAMLGAPIQPYESLSIITLPADNGHWSVVIVASATDRALRPCRRVEVWERTVRSYPLVAHWLDADPVTGIDRIVKIEDRVRRFDPTTSRGDGHRGPR